MKAHITVLLLGLVIAAIAAAADQHTTETTPTAEDIEDEEDIGDDAGLITDEFSYMYLFDQSYGVLAGFGKSSPRHLMHLEGLAFLREKLAVSVLVGYGKDQDFATANDKYELTANTLSLNIKARYYLPLLPLSANASCGYVFWHGNVAPAAGSKHDYKSYEAYLAGSISAYYFWKNSIYVETAIYGISLGKAFGLKSDTDEYRDTVAKTIEAAEHYGIFGDGSLNLALGYMF